MEKLVIDASRNITGSPNDDLRHGIGQARPVHAFTEALGKFDVHASPCRMPVVGVHASRAVIDQRVGAKRSTEAARLLIADSVEHKTEEGVGVLVLRQIASCGIERQVNTEIC